MNITIFIFLGINFILWCRIKDSQNDHRAIELALGSIIFSSAVLGILVIKNFIPPSHFWLAMFFNCTIGIWTKVSKWAWHQITMPAPSVLAPPVAKQTPPAPPPITKRKRKPVTTPVIKPTSVSVKIIPAHEIQNVKNIRKKSEVLNRDFKQVLQKMQDIQRKLQQIMQLSNEELNAYEKTLNDITHQINTYKAAYKSQLAEIQRYIDNPDSQVKVYRQIKIELENRLAKSEKLQAGFDLFMTTFEKKFATHRQAMLARIQQQKAIKATRSQLEQEACMLWAEYNDDSFWQVYESCIMKIKQTLNTTTYTQASA